LPKLPKTIRVLVVIVRLMVFRTHDAIAAANKPNANFNTIPNFVPNANPWITRKQS